MYPKVNYWILLPIKLLFSHKNDQNGSWNGQNLYILQNVRQLWNACTSTCSACTSAELCHLEYQKSTSCTNPSSLKLPLIPGWQVPGWVNIYGFYTKGWILWFQLSCFCLFDSTRPHLSCEIFEVCHLEYMYGSYFFQ